MQHQMQRMLNLPENQKYLTRMTHGSLVRIQVIQWYVHLQGGSLERSESSCLLPLKYDCLLLFEPTEGSTDLVHLIIYTYCRKVIFQELDQLLQKI